MRRLAPAVICLAALMMLAAPALAEKKVRWKMAMTWSSTLTPLSNAGPWLAEMVSDMTDGNFEIRFEGAEKHKAGLGILDMVKGGQYEMGTVHHTIGKARTSPPHFLPPHHSA